MAQLRRKMQEGGEVNQPYPVVTGIPQVQATNLTATEEEFVAPEGRAIPATDVTTATASVDDLVVTTPTPSPDLGKIDTTAKIGSVGTLAGATGQLSQGSQIQYADVTGQVSEESIVGDVKEDLNIEATTRYQLSELYKSIEEGEELPAWAAPAVRRVSGIMQQRGVGASSMASAAMVQAIMESGIPIAQADAQAYATMQLKNLDFKQKAALQNALTYSQMDQANLNNRLKAASQNAQAFLAMDTQNLTNKQQAETLTYQSQIQATLTDVAAENATSQLNAKTETQVEEFFAELGAQVNAANKNRASAMRQYNTSEKNAMQQFAVQAEQAREKFNTNMRYTIDQANANWRRQINTVNTATQNEVNRLNVQNEFGASQATQNFLWQKMRDNAAFNFQNAQSKLQRNHQIGMLSMEFANTEKLYDQKSKSLLSVEIGKMIGNWIDSS